MSEGNVAAAHWLERWVVAWWVPPPRRTPHRTTVAAGGRSLPSAVAERLGLRVATPYHSGPQIDPRNRPISLFQPHILIELRTFRSSGAWGRRENNAGSGGGIRKQASKQNARCSEKLRNCSCCFKQHPDVDETVQNHSGFFPKTKR
jgi:hypothetical protein